MIPDWDTVTVVISDLLHQRHPQVERELSGILEKHDVPLLTVEGTKDIWIRDYAPLQIQRGQFIQFRYRPDYLLDRDQHTITKPAVFRSLPFLRERRHSRLILDGGNVVATSRTAILTQKVFAENPTLTERQIQTRLTEKLNVERLIMIRKEPYDSIGHSDGMVRFLTDDTVVVNDYRKISPKFSESVDTALTNASLRLMRLPYRPELKQRAGIPSAVGNYANFLRVGNLIVIPEFGQKDDEEVQRLMATWMPNAKFESLRCEALAREGGVLNCVTWTIQTSAEKRQRRSRQSPTTAFLAE